MMKKDYSKLVDVRALQRVMDDIGYTEGIKTEGINVSNSKLNRKKKLTRRNITKAPVRNIRRAYKELQKFTEDNITSDTQGKKRIRGTGTGTHQRAISQKTGMRRGEAMRRFREAGERRRSKTHRKGTSLKRFLARVKRSKKKWNWMISLKKTVMLNHLTTK